MIRLTNLGNHARLFGVQTPGDFWRAQLKDVIRVADDDGDWEQMLRERIEGLEQLLHDVRDHGCDWFAAGVGNHANEDGLT